jgi:hypothetical protein
MQFGRWIERGARDSRRDQTCWRTREVIDAMTCVLGARLVHWERDGDGTLRARDLLTARPTAARIIGRELLPGAWMTLGSDLLVIWYDGDYAVFDKDWKRLPTRIRRASPEDATTTGSGR